MKLVNDFHREHNQKLGMLARALSQQLRSAGAFRPQLVSSLGVQCRHMSGDNSWHGTTIVCVKKDGKVAMAGDGQVSAGSTVVKGNARKVRRLGDNILVGFAGSTADAMTLLERLEQKLEEHPAQVRAHMHMNSLCG